MTIDIVDEERPQKVDTRFELAARRLTDGWISAGRFQVSAADFRLAREFLERTGMNVTELPGLLVRLRAPRGRAEEMTREGAVLVALRRLAARGAAAAMLQPTPPRLRLVSRRPAPAASAPEPPAPPRLTGLGAP